MDAPRGFVEISVSATHGCAITSDDQLVCWGSNENGQLNLPDEEYTSVVTARGYTCAIAGDGQLHCSGLLTLANEGEHPWVSVNASVEFACAVDSEGNGACWPKDSGLYDDTGQLEVPVDQRFREIAGTGTLACGLTTSHSIVCWGSLTGKAIPGVIPTRCPQRDVHGHRNGHRPTGAQCGRLGPWLAGEPILTARPMRRPGATPRSAQAGRIVARSRPTEK